MQSDEIKTCGRTDEEMSNRVRFELTKEQVDLLRNEYSGEPIVSRVLSSENNLWFDITEDDDLEFYGWLEDESCRTMEHDEPTERTYEIEGILDSIYAQTE